MSDIANAKNYFQKEELSSHLKSDISNANAKVAVVTANPSAIGLFGLAMVTLIASSQKLGWTEGTALIIPWAIFLGAMAQLYACINDAKLNNVLMKF